MSRNPIKQILPATMRQSAAFKEIKTLDQPEIKIRNRPFLAGSSSNNFPETIAKRYSKYLKTVEFNGDRYTNVEGNESPFSVIGKEVRDFADECFNDGFSAVYIKNLPIKTSKDFNNLIKHTNFRSMDYSYGTAYREEVEDLVYTASDEPPEFTIEPHNEMSYMDVFPTKIIFCCIKAADHGGESPIVFNRDISHLLHSNWVDKIRQKGIRYIRNLKHEKNSNYITWQATFNTKSIDIAEEMMRKQSICWKWLDNGDLTMWYKGNVFINHPTTGEEIWFNQATANHCSYYQSHPMYKDQQNLEPSNYLFHSTYGDGEEFEDELVDHIRSVQWQCAVPIKLQDGDILILDNLLAQHTRMSYKGDRKILVHLAESINDVKL